MLRDYAPKKKYIHKFSYNPLFAILITAIAAAILAPIVATLIQLAVSRRRELLADASGVSNPYWSPL